MLKNSTLPRRSRCCLLKKEPFVPGSTYLSTLSEEGERADYCVQCWEKVAHKNKKFFWKSKIPIKKVESLSSDDRALAYFRSLYAEGEKVKILFVLAQYLERRKELVKLTDEKNPHLLFYEWPQSGELFSLEPQQITATEGEAIEREIADHLVYG